MSRRLAGLLIPLACAALFVRLGIWQLDRLAQRRAFNATLVARMSAPPVDAGSIGGDTASSHYRRVSAHGSYLFDREVVLGGRSHEGSPGVYILTPLKLEGRDTVVMVNRGWAYSEDAGTVDLGRWRERDTATVTGYLETYPGTDPVPLKPGARLVHRLDHARVASLVGLPVSPMLIVQTSDSSAHGDSVPVRLPTPSLDEGPHKSYAIQWFSFATIAVLGGIALYVRGGAKREPGAAA
ncbi:MAG: SURF1 family protein [Gemmatimonadetes bacterium]|nr:SURF1 family protein [Gemmatimonadota bacterium]MBI3568563.1 SURF1 family protein [Gemmatimonadota bacterium]